MALNTKTVALIRALHEKTRGDEITWEKTSNPASFQTSWPKYSIILRQTETNNILLFLSNDRGEVIERYSSEPAPPEIDQLMHETFEMARRKALGVDEAVDEILKSLTSKRQ
jgi:hypothetical protein